MKRLRNSISRLSVRTFQRSYRNVRRVGSLHRKANLGLLPSQFMPMEDLDLMTFYMQRMMDDCNEAPADVLKLIEQLTNVEEKVKAMEELLGGVRHRNVNVLSVKENYYDDGPSADKTRTKIKWKRRKRCLCIPWGCSPEVSEPFKKKTFVRRDLKNRGAKKGATNIKEEHRNDTRSSVSWDEDITVRYIGSSEEVLGKSSKKKRKQVQKYRSDEESPDSSPNRDGLKDVVHVKIRIPKQKNESNSIIEITGQNIEDYEKTEELDEVVKSVAMLNVKKSEVIQEDLAPEENTVEIDEDYSNLLERLSSNIIQGKTMEKPKTTVRTMNVLNSNAEAENAVDNDRANVPQEASELMSKSEPKQSSGTNEIPEPIISSEHRVTSLDSRKLSGCRGTSSRRIIETKITHDSRSSMSKNDKSQAQDQEDLKPSKEYVDDGVSVDPITMVERADRTSEISTFGIPIKESGRRTCSSQGCKCRGSTKNDNNLYELKRSLRSNSSNLSLLEEAVEKPTGPEEINVDIDSGKINVVTHHSICTCVICQTFGSREDDSRRNSIRSDTGAIVSKRVIRVRYNDDFRNVLTHTEECGCDICIGIDEQIFKNRFLRSTTISTKDSTVLVQNRGICGCTDCKTVTTIPKPSKDMEDLKNDMEEFKNGMETMVSRTSYRSVDPCYYSDATIPSINSFPLKNATSHQKPEITSPSTDSLNSSEEEVIRLKKIRNYEDLIVNPAVKHVTLNRNQHDTNKSLIMISAKNKDEYEKGSNGSYSNKWSRKSNKRGRRYRTKNSYVEQWPEEDYSGKKKYQNENSDFKQEKIKYHVTSINKKSKIRRNKAREDRMFNKQRDKQENQQENKQHKNSLKRETPEGRPKKVSGEYRSVNNRNYEREAQQTTLEDIIKDLVSGQTEEKGDKTYTVTLGKIHDKPYTKVKIIDCSKRVESDNSSASFNSTQPSSRGNNQESSNSTVLFLKPIPSINVSPTCSSNFTKSGVTSEMNVSRQISGTQCRVSSSVLHSCLQPTPPSPSLFIISPMGNDGNSMEDENTSKIMVSKNNFDHSAKFDVSSTSSKYRQRNKHSKFTIKLSRKVCSFFRRNGR